MISQHYDKKPLNIGDEIIYRDKKYRIISIDKTNQKDFKYLVNDGLRFYQHDLDVTRHNYTLIRY